MRILIVASINSHGGQYAPFITEQAKALQSKGFALEYFGIVGHGIIGYWRNIRPLVRVIRDQRPDIIHAHYGLCALIACLAGKWTHTPVVVTYHGSDINVSSVLRFSLIAMRLAAWNIFVSQRNIDIAHRYTAHNTNWSLLPCGINLPADSASYPDMQHILLPNHHHVLFAGAFGNVVKDAPLAQAAANYYNTHTQSQPIQLIELKGYTREQVYGLMYACDAFLMTSKTEGSPQVIKESMACGLPIVSVNVGDVAERVEGVEGCYLASSRKPQELADLLSKAVTFARTQGRQRIITLGLTNDQVAAKLVDIYNALKYPKINYGNE